MYTNICDFYCSIYKRDFGAMAQYNEDVIWAEVYSIPVLECGERDEK